MQLTYLYNALLCIEIPIEENRIKNAGIECTYEHELLYFNEFCLNWLFGCFWKILGNFVAMRLRDL